MRHRLSDRAKFTFGLSGTAREFDAYGQRDRHAAFVEFGRGIAGADIALRLGSLMEEGSLLDSVTGGAYESFDSAQTTFFTAAARLPIGEHSALTGHLSHGFTEVDETGRGLLGSFSTIRTLSFGTAAISHALFRDDDIVALSLSHPLRITGGTVTLNVPTGIDYLSGAIERTAERASLVPQGREIDIELSYGFSPLAGFDVQANLLYRREPGHVRSAPDDATLLVLLKRTF